MKKIRLTEKDLQRIVKRTISEQRMGDEKMVNPHHRPITIEIIRRKVKEQLWIEAIRDDTFR